MDGSGIFLGSVYSTLQFKTAGFANEVANAQRDLRGLGTSFGQADRQSTAFSDNLGGAVRAGLLATGAATAAAGFSAVKMAGDFEQSLSVLRYNSNATADEFTKLSARARELGKDASLPGVSAADAANAMNELAKAGLKVNDILGASRGVLSLAKAGQVDVGTAASITAAALSAFNLQGTEASRVADLLAAGANSSLASVTDLGFSLQASAASASLFKVPVEDTITALSLLAKNGLRSSDAGTSLKTMFLSLANPTGRTQELMKKLNIDFFDARGNFIGLAETAGMLQSRLGKLSDEEKNMALDQIFGSDASRAAAFLLKEGAAGFEQMSKAVNKQGAAVKAAAAYNDGFKGSLDALKSTLQTVGTDLGTKVLPPLTDFTRMLTTQVEPSIDFLIRNGPALASTLGVIGGAFGAIRVAAFAKDLSDANDYLKFFVGETNAKGVRTIGGAFKASGKKIADVAVSLAGIATDSAAAAKNVSKEGAKAAAGWVASSAKAVGSWVVNLAKIVGASAVTAVKVSAHGAKAAAGWVVNAARVSAAWLLHFSITQGAAVLAGIKTSSPATYAAIIWVANAAKVSAAWILHLGRVVASAAATAAKVSASAAVTAVGWVANAVRVATAWTVNLLRVVASAIATAAVVSTQAVIAAALWITRPVVIAFAWAVGMLRAGASAVAAGTIIAAQAIVASAAHVRGAAVAGLAWIANMAKSLPFAIGWTIGMVAQVGIVSASYIAGAVAATAAWVVANAAILGPIALVVAAVVGGAYLITKNWGNVKTFFAGLPSQIVGALSGLGNSLYGLGRDMIQGLLSGAGSLLRTVGSFFLNQLPSWIVSPFKKALGIHSPSTVFAGYGTNVVEGLAAGIAGSRGLLNSAMSSLDAQMTVSPARPSYDLPSQGNLFSGPSQAAAGGSDGRGGVNIEQYVVNNDIDPERIIRDMTRRVALA